VVTRGPVAVVLPASVVSVRVATAAVRKARRALVLPVSSLPSSVVVSDVDLAVVVPLLHHRGIKRHRRRER